MSRPTSCRYRFALGFFKALVLNNLFTHPKMAFARTLGIKLRLSVLLLCCAAMAIGSLGSDEKVVKYHGYVSLPTGVLVGPYKILRVFA